MIANPSLGDIGEPLRHIIVTEPVEAPISVPVPEEVPA
jgi:hypothetical protein